MSSAHDRKRFRENGTREILSRRRIDRRRFRPLHFEPLEDRRLLTTITVNTLIDVVSSTDAFLSLREAVMAADPNDTINFSVTGTIALTNISPGHIVINKNLTIQGPGANLLTIKAYDPDSFGTNNSNGRRAFVVDNSSSLLNVTISGLTITNGDPVVSGESDGGGAILNRENLTISACVITSNYAPNGGGIQSTAGTLTINDSTISENLAGDGGGLLVEGGSITINRSLIANNQATNSGSGVMGRSVGLTIADSTVSGNLAEEHGGGLYQYRGTMSVTGSTIASNASDTDHDDSGNGGGIFNTSGSLTVTSSTISGNASGENGAGIFLDTGQAVTIAHSTITGNVVASGSNHDGGGIFNSDDENDVALNHTIVAGNLQGASTPDNIEGAFDAEFSLVGGNPKLSPLANNGGPTQTHALMSDSPALDAGDGSVGPGTFPTYDQRGTPYSRVVDFDGVGGPIIDIGAVEMTPPVVPPALPGDYTRNSLVDAADYVLWRETKDLGVPQYSGADGDGDSIVTDNDYTVWRSHFNNPVGALPSEEPLDLASIFIPTSAGDSTSEKPAVAAPISVAPDSAIDLLLAIDPQFTASAAITSDGSVSDDNLLVAIDPETDSLLGELGLELGPALKW